MKPYLIHQDKMWFVIAGCRIVAIVNTKTEGMQLMRTMPRFVENAPRSENGAGPSGKA